MNPIEELLENMTLDEIKLHVPEAQAVLEMGIDEIAIHAPDIITPEKLAALATDLAKL